MALVPQVCDAVDIPVIAAGGIGDGRGVAAAFMLGACGVQLGTRFLVAKECTIHQNYKDKVLAARDIDTDDHRQAPRTPRALPEKSLSRACWPRRNTKPTSPPRNSSSSAWARCAARCWTGDASDGSFHVPGRLRRWSIDEQTCRGDHPRAVHAGGGRAGENDRYGQNSLCVRRSGRAVHGHGAASCTKARPTRAGSTICATRSAPARRRSASPATRPRWRSRNNTQPCDVRHRPRLRGRRCGDAASCRRWRRASRSGEVAAAAFTGMLDMESAFRLVVRRGQLMQACAEAHSGSMAAVLRLPNETVEALCASFSHVYPVNYNCAGQLTVAGDSAEMPAFIKAVTESGGRAVPLAVSGAFHSPFMDRGVGRAGGVPRKRRAARAGAAALRQPDRASLRGRPARELLAAQVKSPVRWEETVRAYG